MRKIGSLFTVAALCLILFSYAFAQNAAPKEENKHEADLIELIKLDKTIKLDIRYATANNFVGRTVYPEARAFLQRPAAEGVVRVHKQLKKQGLGLVIYDGYRPWAITKLFWDVVTLDQRKYVADPATGSKHNRGCAVDLGIYDLKTGNAIPMPSGFDEFTERASPDYKGGTVEERANRDILRRLMEAENFTVNPSEWWHFDYNDWGLYAIYDIPFTSIRNLNDLEGLVVRRVEFAGNIYLRDRYLRKRVFLKAGDIFDPENIRKSIESMNKLGELEMMTDQDISWYIDRANGDVDFIFYFREKSIKKQRSNL
ncbi:MAG: hypothetical protein IPL32_06255 [Chloracidobacterium sp.]|nr:hypothetical protein [Chloracidobacterium sp.]